MELGVSQKMNEHCPLPLELALDGVIWSARDPRIFTIFYVHRLFRGGFRIENQYILCGATRLYINDYEYIYMDSDHSATCYQLGQLAIGAIIIYTRNGHQIWG